MEFCSSLVVDHLSTLAPDESKSVVYFYCDYQDGRNRTPSNIIGALVKQLVVALPEIPDEIVRVFRAAKRHESKLGLADASRMLALSLHRFCRIYICIDALDECQEPHRSELLRSLGSAIQGSASAQLFLTGRDSIRGDVKKCLELKSSEITVEAHPEDITKYVANQIETYKGNHPHAMNDDLGQDIVKKIIANSQGMYAPHNSLLRLIIN